LALDLGISTGWALQERNRRICSGSQPFRPQRYEGGGMRFLRFQRWLTELSQASDASASQLLIDQVVFEEVRRHAGVDAAHAYGGFLGQLGSFCEHHRIPYQGVPVGTIKRHITGKGNASKEAVIAAIRELGYSPVDDNEADALALLHWAIATAGGER
jgi:Holliday junction resolvasome RuvABC endonuclease subunit